MNDKKSISKQLLKPSIAFTLSLAVILVCLSVLSSFPLNAEDGINVTQQTNVTSLTEQPPTTSEPIVTTLPYDEPMRDADEENEGLLGLLGINDNNGTLDLVLLITILSLAPSILILMTCFTRIIIVFSLLRNAIGVQQAPPNQVLIGLALFLSLFIMAPVVKEVNEVAYQPYKAGDIDTTEALTKASVPLKKFMLQQTNTDTMEFFLDLSDREMPTENIEENLGLDVVVPAYVLSEIKTAFSIGFILFIPFLIIDIVVSSILMSMGMIMLPPAMISLPFKILLFILIDGWQLLAGTLVKGFNF